MATGFERFGFGFRYRPILTGALRGTAGSWLTTQISENCIYTVIFKYSPHTESGTTGFLSDVQSVALKIIMVFLTSSPTLQRWEALTARA